MKRNIHRKRLTIAEEEIMLILWKKEKAFIKDILEACAEPRPAYNTVSTVLRVLEKKGFVSHRKEGIFYEFSPALDKEEYAMKMTAWLLEDYYDNRPAALIEACRGHFPAEAMDEVVRAATRTTV